MRRLSRLLVALPIVAIVLAFGYQLGMTHVEGKPRTFGESIQWSVSTMTTTGFGPDVKWSHPAMIAYAIVAQFAGVTMIFLVFPVFVIPFLEERFESRLPAALPDLANTVVIFHHGPAITVLLADLEEAGVPFLLVEEDEPLARRLKEQGVPVVLGDLENDAPDLAKLRGARALVANRHDEDNAAIALSARYHGFTGPVIAMVENPVRRSAMLRAGATTAFTPSHVLAAAISARASDRLSPRLSGVRHLGAHLEVAELRIHASSALAGRTIRDAQVRSRTGATIVGLWIGGRFVAQPDLGTPLDVGTILVAVGSRQGILKLGALAPRVHREGPILVLGNSAVGEKTAEILRLAHDDVVVVDHVAAAGVDVVGDPLDPEVIDAAGAGGARAVVLALESDSATLFAAAVVRSLAPDVLILAAAQRVENVARIHRAGADFALSLGQVAGQLLTFHLLGRQSVSLEAEIKLLATSPGPLAGQSLNTRGIRERTGCSVAAVERGDEVRVEFDGNFTLERDDIVYICGTTDTIARYFKEFPGARAAEFTLPGPPPAATRSAEAVPHS